MLRKSLQIAQILSLDVVLGAVVSSMFVAKFLSVDIPLSHLTALGIAVWLIYTADHLSDAKKVKHRAHTSRHRYHQKKFKTISIGCIIVALIGLYNLSLLPIPLLLWGIALSVLVALYFFLMRLFPRARFFHKEFIIAFLYASGVFLAPLQLSSDILLYPILIFFGQYFLLALINVLLISWYEKDSDIADGHLSFVIIMGRKMAMRTIRNGLILLYFSILLCLTFFGSLEGYSLLQLLLLLMGITLHAIAYQHTFFSKNERYRHWADAIFYFPILYLLIH